MRKFKVGMAAVLILGIMALFVIVGGGLAQGPALPPGEYDLEAGQYVFTVPELADTSVPPTDTPIPPTETPEPLHDRRAWHPVSADISHEHKANPHDVDDVFGTDIYAWAGGEISYPWQTFKGAGPDFPPPPSPGDFENDFKHEAYGWLIADEGELTCGGISYSDGCVVAYRVQYHGLMAPLGALSRTHSFWAEVKVCQGEQCGTIHTGGWVSYGQLIVNFENVRLPGDNPDGARYHFTADHLQAKEGYWASDNIWGDSHVSDFIRLAIRSTDVWAPINLDDLSEFNPFCPDFQCEENASRFHVNDLIVNATYAELADENGIINYDGFTNRYGTIVENCTEIGLDCVPLKISGVPVGFYVHGLWAQKFFGQAEFDISPPGEFWISYPN